MDAEQECEQVVYALSCGADQALWLQAMGRLIECCAASLEARGLNDDPNIAATIDRFTAMLSPVINGAALAA